MNWSKAIYLILVLLFLIVLLFVWQYCIVIYEVTYSVQPSVLYADNQTTATIKTVPLNSFGNKAWFRNSAAEFEFIEGEELIEVIELNNSEGLLVIKAKLDTGNVVLRIKSEHSLFPSMIEIPVKLNIV